MFADLLLIDPQAVLCGFIIGLCIGFTGVGGGVLVIPALTFFFDLPPSVAVGTAGIYTTLTKIMAGAENIRRGNVNYPVLIRASTFALPGVLVSALAVNIYLFYYPETMMQDVVRGAIVSTILFSLFVAHLPVKPRSGYLTGGLAIGSVVVGLIMGLTGIGGGVLIAPVLLVFGGLTPKRIVGTSILIALVISSVTALIYAGGGQVNYELALWMSVGSLFATPLGGMLLRRASETIVHRAMVVLILLATILMMFS